MTRLPPSLIVFCLAIALHLVVIGRGFWQERYPEGSSDEARYVFYAESIRAGRGMHAPGYEDKPTAYVMPMLPLVLAPAGTDSLVRLRVIQLLLSGGVAALTFQLGKQLGGAKMGWLAAVCLLANLGWMQQPLFLLTEPLFTLFMLIAIAAFIYRPEDWRYLTLAGVSLGLAWLTRGALAGVLAFIFPFLWWKVGFRKMLWVGITMGFTILPWGIRNYLAMDTFLITSTQSGNVVAGAYNDVVYDNPWGDSWINPDEIYRAEAQQAGFFDDEVRYSNYLGEKGSEWIGQNPEKLPKLLAAHIFGYMRPWFKIARNDLEWGYEVLSWGVGGLLLLYGMVYALKTRQDALIWLLLVLLGGFITALVFYGTPRFRLPYAPYIALLEAVALQSILAKTQANER